MDEKPHKKPQEGENDARPTEYVDEEYLQAEAEAAAAGQDPDPGHSESLGPAAALFRDAEKEFEGELKGKHGLVGEHEMEVEPENIPAGQITGLILVICVAIVGIVITMFIAGGISANSVTLESAAQARYPEREMVEAKDADRMNNYGVVDPQNGIYRIPVDRAMELMVEEAWRETRATAPTVQPGPGAMDNQVIEQTREEQAAQAEDARERNSSGNNE